VVAATAEKLSFYHSSFLAYKSLFFLTGEQIPATFFKRAEKIF
jgi:hypothetical protein